MYGGADVGGDESGGPTSSFQREVMFSAARHFQSELGQLQFKAVCSLGRNTMPAVAEVFGVELTLGQIFNAELQDWKGLVALAPQPMRGKSPRILNTVERLWSRVHQVSLQEDRRGAENENG